MKESRKLFNSAGASLYSLVIIFSLLKDVVLTPISSLIWRYTLMTTPDGFISNANIVNTLVKSPWIILVGVFLISLFLLISMWQVSATVLGVAYAREGISVKAIDLLKISARGASTGIKSKNWMILLYTAIILPFISVFQASEMIGVFVIPEYISDFINANLLLSVLHVVLMIGAIYIALRWFYVLPAFYLKERDFKQASKESFELTKKGALKNGIRLVVYGIIESIRLALIPFIVLFVVCTIACILVAEQPLVWEVFNVVVMELGTLLLRTVSGVMVYLSSICFVVNEYYKRLDECENNSQGINLPESPGKEINKGKWSGLKIQIIVSSVGSFAIALLFLATVYLAQIAPEVLVEIIHSPYIVAHKGYSSKAPENTMDAFELADKTEKADLIELDVWSSKDGIPVVIHNETVTAATGQKGNIYDYTYEELCNMPAPYAMDADKFPDARIPKLEDVIAKYSETTPIIIEIKGYKKDDMLPAKIVVLMEKYNCTETSMIHSCDYAALKAVKECNPDIRCGLIQAIVTGNCYDLPYADFLSVEHSFITDRMVSQLHSRGKDIYAWTVNYEESADAIRFLNVDGVITDYPDDISEYVKRDIDIIESIKNAADVEERDPKEAEDAFAAGDY